ncbi:uncharacterized protein BDZ83DRAFT_245191 [Colletotrichum acutatum]|uniref:Uncharacterized protein n=1 Tax=Glomerella acutata TaxID=27357 RepID=A0AAD8XQ07_GLOAC|nr:uncharacterized protein BDZ83DRAFT_245191 [Colletotrichum acutatum]KAK1731313.1 hypothetical protein BDZ83DRAFT_245191 [Colletotrichum acutatum]
MQGYRVHGLFSGLRNIYAGIMLPPLLLVHLSISLGSSGFLFYPSLQRLRRAKRFRRDILLLASWRRMFGEHSCCRRGKNVGKGRCVPGFKWKPRKGLVGFFCSQSETVTL